MNPVTLRELRERFRGVRSAVFLVVWLLVVGGVGYLVYAMARGMGGSVGIFGGGFAPLLVSASMGRFMLHALLLLLMTAVIFVVPGQAALAIVGERERQTLHLLQVSQLGAYQIVLGKLGSSLAYLLLLLVAAAPLLVLPALFGGTTVGEVLAGLGMILATAFTVGSLSIWVSSRARSSRGAVAGAYTWALALAFGTLLLLVAEVILGRPGPGFYRTDFGGAVPRDQGRELYASWPNPYIGMVSAVDESLEFRTEYISSPFAPLRPVILKRQGFASFVSGAFGGGGMGAIVPGLMGPGFFGREVFFEGPVALGQDFQFEPIRPPIWAYTLATYALTSAVALALATRQIRVPQVRLRRRHATARAA
jgi:ABC-2 type transport system permease protein